MATSLRPQAQAHQSSTQTQSPTSSTSSVTTTPTSPHFATHQHIQTSSATRVAVNGSGPYVHSTAYAQPGSAVHARPGSSASGIIHPRPPSPPLFRAPSDQTFASYLRTWGDNEIAQFLAVYNCGHHAPAFQKNDIDGKCLLDLDISTLKEIGIVKIGERIKVHNGIKELRKRAAGNRPLTAASASRVELRLNGAATPPLDDVPSLSPGLDELYARGGSGAAASGLRRLGTARPPPLDLHPQPSRNNLPQAYQNAPGSFSESRTITPRPLGVKELSHPVPSRNGSSSSTASDATVVPGSQSLPASQLGNSNAGLGASSSSVPAPAPSRPNNLNLRAPPARDLGRRSPSPVNADPTGFADRPLPPMPAHQSSAAEYASAIRHHAEGRATPTWSNDPHNQQHKPVAPSSERRHQPPPPVVRNDSAHRKNPSLGATPNGRPHSPLKNKFGTAPRANTSNGPVHPFAASRQDERRDSPPDMQSSTGSTGNTLSGKNYRNTPYVIGTGGPGAINRSASITTPTNASSFARRTDGQTPGTLSLEDLRRQLVKFINTEDGTMRTVNVSSCTSGVEVLERVLKKFGKWGTGTTVSTDTESDEDGDRLEVDGWGVYEEQDPDDDSIPLSEQALLTICVLHRDGVVVRENGLTLRRTRKPKYRKNMEEFLGETPPPPMSPTSPTYVAGPRLGLRPDNEMQSPSKPGGVKKMNRASMISVMSGLGVPGMGNPPPSPTTAAKTASSGSFLAKSKRNYNFFGHRPSSELIADNVEHYFPSAKKRELEKTLRHSMLRMSMAPNAYRKSVASSIAPSERVSLDSDRRTSVEKTPPSRRPTSRTTSFASSPPTETIPEETEMLDNNVPRVAVTSDGSPLRMPRSSGESDRASIDSRPNLLPPFEPGQTLSKAINDSPLPADGRPHLIQQHSNPGPPRPRPKSILQARRGSAGSSRSRMSMLSQLRKNRDRSDTASMLTVDEITAEVEHRRASTITFDESDEEVDTASLRVPSMADPGVPTSDLDEEEEESDECESSASDEEEDDDDDEDEKEHGKAVFSTGSRSTIKWLKGALIGAGSFGSVYLGMNSLTGELMAVKQVELDVSARSEERTKGMIEALEREIELLKELQHLNIVQYLDSSTDDRHLNIFLEYVPGGSVAALLTKYGAFEEALVKRFVRQILMGLQYLHERGIIHRDIKGANILVDNKGGVKISDFGISKKVESNLLDPQGQNKAKHRQSLQGSVFWMAPEVVKQTGHSSKADIWSVGCLVVEMLTGTHPWPELNQLQAMFQIGKLAAPTLPADIAPDTVDFLHKTFELDDTLRPTAAELLKHPFIVDDSPVLISAAAAQAAMNNAMAARSAPSMQSLSALAEAR